MTEQLWRECHQLEAEGVVEAWTGEVADLSIPVKRVSSSAVLIEDGPKAARTRMQKEYALATEWLLTDALADRLLRAAVGEGDR